MQTMTTIMTGMTKFLLPNKTKINVNLGCVPIRKINVNKIENLLFSNRHFISFGCETTIFHFLLNCLLCWISWQTFINFMQFVCHRGSKRSWGLSTKVKTEHFGITQLRAGWSLRNRSSLYSYIALIYYYSQNLNINQLRFHHLFHRLIFLVRNSSVHFFKVELNYSRWPEFLDFYSPKQCLTCSKMFSLQKLFTNS